METHFRGHPTSAAPQKTAYSVAPSQAAAHLRTDIPHYAEKIAGFERTTAPYCADTSQRSSKYVCIFCSTWIHVKVHVQYTSYRGLLAGGRVHVLEDQFWFLQICLATETERDI